MKMLEGVDTPRNVVASVQKVRVNESEVLDVLVCIYRDCSELRLRSFDKRGEDE